MSRSTFKGHVASPSIPYLMHKETGCPLIECKKAYDLAMEYLRNKARVKG